MFKPCAGGRLPRAGPAANRCPCVPAQPGDLTAQTVPRSATAAPAAMDGASHDTSHRVVGPPTRLTQRPSSMATKAIVGEKIGMTQVWDDTNRVIPVTVLKVAPARVVQVKTTE